MLAPLALRSLSTRWDPEARRPLLGVAGQALAGVGAGEAEELVGERRRRRSPTGPRYQWFSVCLVQRMADCAPPASWVGDLQGPVLHLVVVDAERHQADALGLLAA